PTAASPAGRGANGHPRRLVEGLRHRARGARRTWPANGVLRRRARTDESLTTPRRVEEESRAPRRALGARARRPPLRLRIDHVQERGTGARGRTRRVL